MISFEDKLKQIEQYIYELENHEVNLEEMMQKYSDVINLINECKEQLNKSEIKIRKLTENIKS